jgi:ABC-type phosphate transport system substrate-binding protein
MTGDTTKSHIATWARCAVTAVIALGSALLLGGSTTARAQDYQRISGEGSSWAANFIDAVRVNVAQFGMTVDYNPSGSTSGRKNYLNGTVDFAASDIPFQFHPEDGSAPENPEPGSYVYIPVTAGGTSFMYNLKINGKQVTNLRLSGENVAKIFTGVITMWNDPAIQADNPGLTMPARAIVPVVRSDGSGSSAQFTLWMTNRHPQIWTDYCAKVGRQNACGYTSFYPTISGMIAQQGDLGISGYVSQGFAEGAIGYVNYSYALGVGFPVAKVLNAGGFYTEPTPENVAVSLLKADINRDESDPAVYLTQNLDGVYANTDPRNYELSSYSYFILPTKVGGQFNEAKGYTLSEFAKYAMCQAQQQSASLGYSPMPINLVQASFEQITKIPGSVAENINIQSCNNPTFSPDGHNVLADNAAMPQACDQQGPSQCPTHTGGSTADTPVNPAAAGGGGGGGGGGGQTGGGSTGGGATGGGDQSSGGGTGSNAGAGQTAQTSAQSGSGATGGSGGTGAQAGSGAGAGAGNATGQPQSNQTGDDGITATTAPCIAVTTTTLAPAGASTPDGASTTSTTTTTTASPSSSAPLSSIPPTTNTLPTCDPTTTVASVGVGVADAAGGIGTGTAPLLAEGCDADTGACGGVAVTDPATGQAAGVPVGLVLPQTLAQPSRWGSSQTLIFLVSILTLALVFAPAVAWRHFGQQGGTT